MLLQEECGSGPHDRRHQRGGYHGDRSMEEQPFLEKGRLSRIEARNIIRMKKRAFNFFATVAVKKYVHVDDMMTPVDAENM
eukprot:299072-Heterocapsa_arctica.AAC.1